MMEELQLEHLLANIPLSFTRTAAAFWTVPFLNEQILSGYTKNSIIMALILPVAAVLPVELQITQRISFLIYLGLVFKEAFIGFMIGLLISIVFWAAQNAGELIDLQRGASSALLYDPMLRMESTPFGNLFFHVIVVLFFINGGFSEMIKTIYDSYAVWPIDDFLPVMDIDITAVLSGTLIRIGRLTLAIAAPIIIACFLVDLSMGLINRFTPNLNVFILALPIKSALTVFMVVMYSHYLLPFLGRQFSGSEQIIAIIKAIHQ